MKREKPPYSAFFSATIGAESGTRVFSGRYHTVPAVSRAGAVGVIRGVFAEMWVRCEEYCRQQHENLLTLPSATTIATELLLRDADTAFAFGEGNDALSLFSGKGIASFFQKKV